MLPWIIGGAIVGVVALVMDDASSDNKRARREYEDTYDESVTTVQNSFYDAQRRDRLDKLRKVKKAKVKIANTLYKKLKRDRANFNSINMDIKASKKSLEYLFAQKRASDDRDVKKSIQQNINTIQLSRKELFKVKDTLKKEIEDSKMRVYQANQETQDIVNEIKSHEIDQKALN